MRAQFSKIALAAGFGLALTFTLSCSLGDDGGGGDDPGGSSSPSGGNGSGCTISGYKTKQIRNQVWMAENLNCDVAGSECYDKKESNCSKYGRLYNWETAKKACPSGWHLPSDDEWDELVSYVEGDSGCSHCAGRLLKGNNSEDKYGFLALPGGYGNSGGYFGDVGYYGTGNWWSASEYISNSAYAYYRYVNYGSEDLHYNDADKSYLFSVRCVQDQLSASLSEPEWPEFSVFSEFFHP